VTGTAETPFEATYALSEKGQFAAEFGEYEYTPKPRLVTAAGSPKAKKTKKASS
jgi:hypothetical protein